MFKFKSLFFWAFSTLLPVTVSATKQASSSEPKGRAIINIFTNFHTGFGTMNDRRGFELDRSYLGYEYKLLPNLKMRGVMDIGKSSDVDDYQRIAYIKNAMISWTHKKLTINGGLIPTLQFGVQEKMWGNRYIMKSFQDYYGFGSSADLGLSVSYNFTNWISVDAVLVNGEGYKKVQIKDGLLYGAGITLNPLDGLILRVYGAINESTDEASKDSYNIATFVGYKTPLFSFACEYNRVSHVHYTPEYNMEGVSVYGSLNLSKSVSLYGRYDQLFVDNSTNQTKEEYKLIGGLEFKIGKYIKLAPNFRYFRPTQSDNQSYCMAYLNCYFGF